MARIIGDAALRGVGVETSTAAVGAHRQCDTVILTGDWIPTTNWPATPASRWTWAAAGRWSTPRFTDQPNQGVRDRQPGAPVDTADAATFRRQPRRRPSRTRTCLRGDRTSAAVPIRAEAPLRWLTPGLLRDGDPLPPAAPAAGVDRPR